MPGSPVPVGREVTFTKTVSESDVYLYAGITGDFSPNHVNQTYMERSAWGRRMAHGMLLVGFVSTASTMAIADTREDTGETPVAVGMDRLRFLKPVFIGDTVTVSYRIEGFDATKRRTVAKAELRNQEGELVAVADHLLQWVRNEYAGSRSERTPAGHSVFRLRCRHPLVHGRRRSASRTPASHATGGWASARPERESGR